MAGKKGMTWGGGRHMSAAGRKRISESMKARWAKRKVGQNGTVPTEAKVIQLPSTKATDEIAHRIRAGMSEAQAMYYFREGYRLGWRDAIIFSKDEAELLKENAG